MTTKSNLFYVFKNKKTKILDNKTKNHEKKDANQWVFEAAKILVMFGGLDKNTI